MHNALAILSARLSYADCTFVLKRSIDYYRRNDSPVFIYLFIIEVVLEVHL